MVISPEFVYLAIPRTASQTLTRHWLPKYGGKNLSDDDYHRMDVPAEHAHKFTFAVVRNPYDRMLSLWYLLQNFSREELAKDNISEGWTPAELVNWCVKQTRVNWLPQDKLLSVARIDRVLRFEQLEDGLRSLPFVGDEFEMPLIHGATVRQPIEDDLTAEVITAINEHSAEDFEKFGYERIAQ